ncbi:MAG: T9SS type B sorting domain-containing protein [Bacteroidota bacterium]
MKKNSITFAFTVFLALTAFAQQEASFWYFGQNAGLRFDATDGTVTALTDGQINTLEGCTSISDTTGNLLFYSDGQTVWNSDHNPMPDGSYFQGTGLLGDPSSTSSGLIVPKPEDDTKFYLFTVDEPHHDNANAFPNQFTGGYDSGGSVPGSDDGFNNGFNYSLIDMNLEGGMGNVDTSEKNIELISYDPTDSEEIKYKCSEKITAVRADDCSSFWVITHFIDKYYAFKVDSDGVNTTPVISTVGPEVPISGYRRNALGYLKASPDGSKLVVAHNGFATVQAANAPGGVYLMDFDNDTGIISNSIELYGPENGNSPYGVEFSAENRKVYASIGGGVNGSGSSDILQWDLESGDIPGSIQQVHSSTTIAAGALQLGLDRRIYRAQFEFNPTTATGADRYIGVINNPEATGAAADYNEQGVLLDIGGGQPNLSRIGLPPFIQSLFNSEIDIIRNNVSTTELKLCDGEDYTLTADDIPTATYTWSKDGVELSEDSFELTIDTPGFYEVFIEPGNGDCPIEGSAVVGIFEIPTATKPNDMELCADNEFTEFDLASQNADILDGQDDTEFEVLYFTGLSEAQTGLANIDEQFTNTSNPQTIYARVQNINNPNCFAITDFTINAFINPVIGTLENITFCDNSSDGNTMDGLAELDLNELIPTIYGTQVFSQFDVSFHSNLMDAENKIDALALNYTNTTPNSEEIFVRLENNRKTDCFAVSSFTFTINNAPVANDITILQCDEDGISEGFTAYDLSDYIPDITGGEANSEVKFYESIDDLENDEDEIIGVFENFFNPQIVYALVTNSQTSCQNIAEITLEVSVTASNDTALEACDDDGNEDGLFTFDLTDAEDAILFGLPSGLDIAYYETYDDALSENNPIPSNYTNTVPNSQTVYARVENANDCFGISRIELTVLELPNIVTEEEVFYCLNTFPETITLTGGFIDDIPNNYLFEWSTGDDETEIQVNEPGTYTVRVSSVDGCFKDRTITVSPSNIASITNIEVTDASSNNVISVMVSGEGTYQYALDNPNGPYQDSPVFENVEFGLRTVYVRDVKNDCGLVNQEVSVIGFPKFFTPNGDSFNPTWQVKGISEDFQANTEVLIFDRQGKLLTSLDPLGAGWDGTYNGQNMPATDYWFVVNLQDGRTFRGHFALVR